MTTNAEDKKEVLDLLTQAIECIQKAEKMVKKGRLIKSRVYYGSILSGLEDSTFHLNRLKFWTEFEKEWTKRGNKQ